MGIMFRANNNKRNGLIRDNTCNIGIRFYLFKPDAIYKIEESQKKPKIQDFQYSILGCFKILESYFNEISSQMSLEIPNRIQVFSTVGENFISIVFGLKIFTATKKFLEPAGMRYWTYFFNRIFYKYFIDIFLITNYKTHESQGTFDTDHVMTGLIIDVNEKDDINDIFESENWTELAKIAKEKIENRKMIERYNKTNEKAKGKNKEENREEETEEETEEKIQNNEKTEVGDGV
jgi:hypothetical protein